MTASATRNGFPTDSRDAVEIYLGRGLAPLPLPPRSKAPDFDEWYSLRLTPDNLDLHFPTNGERNIGLLTGSASNRLVDVDLDCAEAVAAADRLLPDTAWVFGRKSRPRSHRLYRPTGAAAKTRQYRDLGGKMLVELRADRLQTMVPPSIHPEGERVEWSRFDAPGECLTADLESAVARVGAAALLARHWPDKGSRDDAAMALTGGLLRGDWSEDDVSQFVEAVALAAGDEEARSRGRKAAPTARKLEAGDKTTGWTRLAGLLGADGAAVVSCVRAWLGMTAPAEVAAPIPEPLPWPDPPGEEAFYGLPGRIVRTIEPASEADPAALLVQVLTAFGNAVGRAAHFTVEADRHHGNEFVVLVGKTSKARKGTSWGQVFRLMRDAEEQWADDRVQSGASSGEGIIWAVRDAILSRERTKEGGEIQFVEVEKDPGITDKRLLVYEPEFANVLKQTERQGNTLSVILRQAWDGNNLRSLTKNSPAKATGAHVSMVGHITGDELRRYLTQTETANGFANRFLWICADRSKRLPEGGRADPEAMEAHRAELVEALAFARSAGEVRRGDEARALWCDIYGALSEGKPGLAGALLARAEAHVMRLALLYALLDQSPVIRATHLLASLALWDYGERSVYHVFGDDLGDPVADDLLRLLRSCPAGLTRTDLQNYLGRNQPAERIGRALGLLLQHGLARCDRQQTAGRPAERWFAVSKGR